MPAPVYTGASLVVPQENEKLRLASWSCEGLKEDLLNAGKRLAPKLKLKWILRDSG